MLHVIEHANGEHTIYDDKSKAQGSPFSVGDLLVWHNELKDEDGHDLGHSAGHCVSETSGRFFS